MVAEYSIIKGGYPGTGNLSADPRFVNPQSERDLPSLNGDYRLTELSAVIDAGSNTLAAGAGISSTDLDGNPRYADNTGVGDKGEGTAPLIDPGAYEFQGTTTACTGYTYPYTVTSGTGDLTRAIECANLNSTADTIDLNSTTYDISTGYAYTWNIDGLPPLATDITLRNGTLNAGNSRRGLNVGVNTRVQLDTLTIQSGRSTWGGGIYNYGDLTVSNTRLENNIPVLGTVYNRANMLIEKSYVLGNDAFTGGGIFNRAALQVRESVIAGNVAQYGAALHTTDTGTTTITNSTIASNDIQAVGTARGAVIEGFTTVENSIIWNHQRGDIVFSDTPTVSYSIVPFEIDGGFNNLVANPNFMNPVDPVTAPSSSGDYRIQALSPAVDAGSNTLAASAGIGTADIAGNPRYADDTSVANSGEGTSPLIDIGPHESQATACSAYMYPYTVTTENELIGALHCASAKGVSADVIDLNGTTITLTGAYSDAYNRRALPTVYNPVTVQNGTLDGSSITDGFFYVSETGGNLTLDNMTLQNGGAADIYYGGVIDNRAILTIRNSTFSGNQARQGGAIYSSLDATVTNTLFENNHATSTQTGSGGAIYSGAPDANLYVADSTFNGNSAVTLWGSAIYSNSGTAGLTVERSLFSGNTGGTTLYNHFGSMTINDSEFINNSTPFGGGAIVYKEPLAASEINRTLFDSNTAAYAGGAVLNNDGGSSDMLLLTINDSVFINNSASIGSAIYNAGWRGSDFKRYRGFLHVSTSRFDNNQGSAIANSDGSLTIQNSLIANHNRGVYQTSDGGTTTLINTTLSNSPVERDSGGLSIYNSILWGTDALIIGFGTVEYSIVEGGYTGTGNLNVNPQFVEQQTTPGGDYQLADGSPAIDAASNSYGAGSLDLAGNPRYDDDPTTPDTGAGNSPIIDMGAYELQYLPTGTDVNGDGIISPTDAMYVINRLGSGDLSADVDGDGTVDLDDVTVIQNELGNPAP